MRTYQSPGNPRTPRYRIVHDQPDKLVIQDVGPWNLYPTITNGAEEVVAELRDKLRRRRLFYYDSEGQLDELLVSEAGEFAGFAPGPQR